MGTGEFDDYDSSLNSPRPSQTAFRRSAYCVCTLPLAFGSLVQNPLTRLLPKLLLVANTCYSSQVRTKKQSNGATISSEE